MLGHRLLREATLVPMAVGADGARTGGLLRRRRRPWGPRLAPVPESLLWRGPTPYVAAPDPRAVPGARPRVGGRVVVAGFLFNHYGHFLLDSLSRLWIAGAMPEVPLAWAGGAPSLPWQIEMLRLLRVGNPVIDVGDRATDLAEAVLPDEGLRTDLSVAPEQVRFLGQAPAGRGAAKVWLSRSRLPRKGRVAEDGAIEAALERRGWAVVHPQELPLGAQVEAWQGAGRVAGWAASALHTVLLLDGFRGRIDVLRRGDRIGASFELIARAKGLDQRVHALPMRHLGGEGARARWSADPAAVLDALGP